ncbi:MAG: hypothetical protein M1814_001990 [Vezdaea aestivalis]|nr:MAG: hypothetical protein M1814_001990 [Vezdaea aestivalis]
MPRMEFESYLKRKLMLILFGIEALLTALIIIFSAIPLSPQYFGNYYVPVQDITRLIIAVPVFISGIVHLFVIFYTNPILGAVVFVNFVWVFAWVVSLGIHFSLIGGQIYDLKYCPPPGVYDSEDYDLYYTRNTTSCAAVRISLTALAFTILAFILSLVIAILVSIAHRRYRRDINRQLLALRAGTWQVGSAGNPQIVGALPPNMDTSKPFFQDGVWRQWQAVAVPAPPQPSGAIRPSKACAIPQAPVQEQATGEAYGPNAIAAQAVAKAREMTQTVSPAAPASASVHPVESLRDGTHATDDIQVVR